MVCRRTFPRKLKALKTNVICYMAKQEQPFTQLYLQRFQPLPSIKNVQGLTETNLYNSNHPQCIQDYRRNCRSPGYYCRRRSHCRCSFVNTRRCLMGIKRTTSQSRVGCYDEKCLVNQYIMNTCTKYCKPNLSRCRTKLNNPSFLIGAQLWRRTAFQDKFLTTSGTIIRVYRTFQITIRLEQLGLKKTYLNNLNKFVHLQCIQCSMCIHVIQWCWFSQQLQAFNRDSWSMIHL